MTKRKIKPKQKPKTTPETQLRLWTAALGHMGNRDWTQALASFRRFLAAEKAPEMRAGAYQNMANAYLDMGDFDQAMAMWRKAADIAPLDPTFQIGQALTHAYAGEVELAINLLLVIRAAFPHYEGAVNIADILHDLRQQLAGELPVNNFYYQRLSQIVDYHIEFGDYELVESIARRMITLNPEGSEGHFTLGATLLRQKRFAEAANAMIEADRLEPDHIGTLQNLALSTWKLGEHEQALEWLRRAREISPKDAATAQIIGEVYNEMGKKERAISIWKKALRHNRDDEGLRELLVEAGARPQPPKQKPLIAQALEQYGPAIKASMSNPRVYRSGDVTLTLDPGIGFILEDAGNEHNGTIYKSGAFNIGEFSPGDILTLVGLLKLMCLQATVANTRELVILAYYPDGDVFSYQMTLASDDDEEWLDIDGYGRFYAQKLPTLLKIRADSDMETTYGTLNGYFIYLKQDRQPGIVVSTWGHMP